MRIPRRARRISWNAIGVPCCCPTYSSVFLGSATQTSMHTIGAACRWRYWAEQPNGMRDMSLAERRVYRDVNPLADSVIADDVRFAVIGFMYTQDIDKLAELFEAGGRVIFCLGSTSGGGQSREEFNGLLDDLGVSMRWGESHFLYCRTEVAPGRFAPWDYTTSFTGSSVMQDMEALYFKRVHEVVGGSPLAYGKGEWEDVAGKPVLCVERVGNGFAMMADGTAFTVPWGPIDVPDDGPVSGWYPVPGNAPAIHNFISCRDDEITSQ